MAEIKFKRRHLRSPLPTVTLYQSDRYVFKAYALNISEGGVLLENLPSVPEVNAIPLLLSLPLYPELSSLSVERIHEIEVDELKTKVIRVKARIVRQFEGMSAVDQVFITRIGCEFVQVDEQATEAIKVYVSTFAKNTIHLLNLFESHGNNDSRKKHIRYIAKLLGYVEDGKLSLLRQQVLHDYQSLESL